MDTWRVLTGLLKNPNMTLHQLLVKTDASLKKKCRLVMTNNSDFFDGLFSIVTHGQLFTDNGSELLLIQVTFSGHVCIQLEEIQPGLRLTTVANGLKAQKMDTALRVFLKNSNITLHQFFFKTDASLKKKCRLIMTNNSDFFDSLYSIVTHGQCFTYNGSELLVIQVTF